jgi:hypothetical protein
MPDHGALLANLVRWSANEEIPLTVDGPGFIDCPLYRQVNRLILHVLNLTNANTWRGVADELIPVGPLKISVRLPDGIRPKSVRRLVIGGTVGSTVVDGTVSFSLDRVLDHEVLVVE